MNMYTVQLLNMWSDKDIEPSSPTVWLLSTYCESNSSSALACRLGLGAGGAAKGGLEGRDVAGQGAGMSTWAGAGGRNEGWK